MKPTKGLSIFLAAGLALSSAGLAASGGMDGSTLISIRGDALTVSETLSAAVEGDLPEFPDAMAAIRFEAGAAGEKFLSVSASEHADPLTDGFTAVLGDARELYAAPNLAEIYANEGLNPNAEGYDLDYRWIGQIDWDRNSETCGAYTPATERGRAVYESVNDGAFSVYVEGGAGEGGSAGRGTTQVTCAGGAALLVKNSFLYSEGLEGMAISNSGTAGLGSTLVVRDSLLVTRGYVPASAGVSENLPNDPLLVTGADRTSLSGGESETYYYDSAVITDGWASLSTDAASGSGVDLVAVNTFASALLGGYGTYADGNCRDYLYASVLEGAEIGVIIAGTGEVSLFDGDEGVEGGTGYQVGADGGIDPYAFASEEDKERYAGLGGSVIAGGRNALMMHVAGSAPEERQGLFYARDSALVTDPALYAQAGDGSGVNAAWYGRELSPNIQKYIQHTQGDAILLKSTNAEIVLDRVTIDAYSGVLIHSVLNNDTSTPATEADVRPVGSSVYLVDMEAEGDIWDEDYERVMSITLDGTNLTGAIRSGTCEDWTNFWLDAGYARDYTIGLASNTFGQEAPLDSFVHALSFDEDGAYTYTPYGDDRGTELSLVNGACWTVTGESRLSALSIDFRSEVRGVMTVDGVQTSPAPGRYEGEILLHPAGTEPGASGEASGETSGELSGEPA